MNLKEFHISIGNEELYFYAPEGDDCVIGTLQGLVKNDWKLDKIDFKPGDFFVDIGCNVGLVSLVAAKLFPYITIWSFDANPIAIECLRKSIKKNNITNINNSNLAVGNRIGIVDFVTYSENETCTVQKEISNPRAVTYSTPMITPDGLFKDILEDKVKYLKCDIEGGEFALFDYIFEKCPEILNKIEYLHIEIHPFDDNNPPTFALKKKLEAEFKNKLFY